MFLIKRIYHCQLPISFTTSIIEKTIPVSQNIHYSCVLMRGEKKAIDASWNS